LVGWLQTKWFNWSLGIVAAIAFVLLMAVPSRIPAVILLLLVAAGVIVRRVAVRTAKQDLPLVSQAKSFVVANAEYFVLGGILLLAIGLRFLGIRQSLPYIDNPDEPTATLGAIKMLQTGDLNPHYFRWGSLLIYVQFILALPQFLAGVSGGQFSNLQEISTDGFYLIGRIFSATLGVATIFLVWLIGRKLYNSAVGLLAAFILTVIRLHAEHSKYITPDVTVTFFATLALFFAVNIFQTGKQKWYLWVGVSAGLAAGTKYNVAIVLVLVVLAHFFCDVEKRGKLIWIGQSVLLAGITYLFTTPFTILDLTGWLNEMAFQILHYAVEGHGGVASSGAAWSAYIKYTYNEVFVGIGIVVLAGAILVPLVRQKREDWLLLALPAVGYLFFSAAKTHFSRNLLPLVPPLAILSAVFLIIVANFSYNVFLNKTRLKQSVSVGVIVVLLTLVFFSVSLWDSVQNTRYYMQTDTRVTAGNWMVENIPAGAKLRMEQGAPYLPAGRYKEADQRRPIGGRDLAWYKSEGYDYLIAVSYQYRDLSAGNPQAAENYRSIFSTAKLVKEFPGDNPSYPGPTIRIYSVK
jgi:hypothetical protein